MIYLCEENAKNNKLFSDKMPWHCGQKMTLNFTEWIWLESNLFHVYIASLHYHMSLHMCTSCSSRCGKWNVFCYLGFYMPQLLGVALSLPMFVRPSVCHLISLNNLTSPKANHLKFIHKVREHKERPSSTSDFFPF